MFCAKTVPRRDCTWALLTHPVGPTAPVSKADMAPVTRVTSLGDKGGGGTPWDSGDATVIAAMGADEVVPFSTGAAVVVAPAAAAAAAASPTGCS